MGAIGAVLLVLGLYALSRHNNMLGLTTSSSTSSNSSSSPSPSSSSSSPSSKTPIPTRPAKQKATRSPGGTNASTNSGWACIAQPDRLSRQQEVTVTGTVLSSSTGPHTAPDGDLVFSFKLDPQFKSLVNAKNNDAKYAGGIWVEAVCQKSNKSTEAWHKGDCANCTPKKFFTPKVGQRLRISGTHVLDTREGGHAEIHPVSEMTAI
jgi:hypothetical protein